MATRVRTKDGEMLSLFFISFLGFGVLAAVNLFYSDWPGMIDTWAYWGAAIGVVGIIILIRVCFVMFKEWKDPNYDKYRHGFWIGCLLMIIYICGFKAANNEARSVIDDSNKAKQEQLK